MLMDELVRYDPDLVIIYTGHNEFLEERTYGALKKLPSTLRGLGGLLSRTRTYAVTRRLLGRDRDQPAPGGAPRPWLPAEVKTRLDDGVGPDAFHRDDAWRKQVLLHYRFNLNRMVTRARSAGVAVVLVTPASNLRDCAPFKSQHREGLGDQELQRFRSLLDVADKAEEDGHPDQALAALDEAASIDDRYAHLHYRRGKLLDRLGRYGDAKTALMRARDEDVCPLRAPTPLGQIVTEVAAELHVPLIDFVALLEHRCEHGIPGANLFLDHVHPTIEGHRRLALALLDQMTQQGIVTLGPEWGDASIQRVVQRVEGRVDRRAHGIALLNLSKVLAWAGKNDEADRLALRAAELVSGDANAYYQAGNALLGQGRLEEGVAQLQKALAINPKYLEAHNSLGAAYQMQGKLDAAVAEYQATIRIKPDFAPAHCNLGALLHRQGKLQKAAEHFETALRVNPDYSKARNNFGALLRQQDRLDDAADQLEAAIRIDPQLAEAHYNLGLVRARQGRHGQAQGHFEQALRVKPSYAPARVELARQLQQQGSHRAAVAHLRRVLEQKRPPLDAGAILAWILATSEDPTVRSGTEAVQLALGCVKATGAQRPDLLATLAAAYAETGDFQAAVRWQARALDQAEPDQEPDYRSRLEQYQTTRPYRQNGQGP
jgi:tetratricopeptide (TPR) repeat protein